MNRIHLAPIRGITDSIFRNALAKHFGGIDFSIAPFLRLGKDLNRQSAFNDLSTERNQALSVVPQLLGNNPKLFLEAANRLGDLGHSEINWNLGCPYPTAIKKKHGAGLLPHPDLVVDFLETVIPHLSTKLSIKTRLGIDDPEELAQLVPRLDDFPIAHIVVHPRTAAQKYDGDVHIDRFLHIIDISSHPIVYNGDITSYDSVKKLTTIIGKEVDWMIGRGVISNPFLGAEIKSMKTTDEADRLGKISDFHDDIYRKYQDSLFGPAHLLDKMRSIWSYLGTAIGADRRFYKKLRKVKRVEDYIALVNIGFANARLGMSHQGA